MKEKHIEWFIQARDEWSDEIPKQMLDGSLPDGEKEYKCRKNWFYGVLHMVDLIIHLQEITEVPEILQKYKDYVESTEFSKKERTTSEDIQLGNKVIQFMLESL